MGTVVHDPFSEAGRHLFGITAEELDTLMDFDALLQFEIGAIGEETYLGRCLIDRRPVAGAALRAYLLRSYR